MAWHLISHHAVARYVERVDSTASENVAHLAISQIVTFGRTRPLPRHWMRNDVEPSPGLSFVIWSRHPHVCLLVRDHVVVSTLTRAMCTPTERRHPSALELYLIP